MTCQGHKYIAFLTCGTALKMLIIHALHRRILTFLAALKVAKSQIFFTLFGSNLQIKVPNFPKYSRE